MNHAPHQTDHRPHLVMLVGNHIVGDSRVEKSAVSARRAGYRVTVVGKTHRSTFPIGQYEGVPIYRTPIQFPRQHALNLWSKWKTEAVPVWTHLVDQEGDAVFTPDEPLPDAPAPEPGSSRWRRDRVAERLDSTRDRVAARVPGGWRRVWPEIVDYEESFLRTLLLLKPDLIHVHDRHPLAAAAAYTALMATRGRRIPWLYDAHEWIPGQAIPGKPQARIGWIAAEAELIRRADGVATVTEDLADRMKKRHRLSVRPSVVINAPLAASTPMDPQERRPLREECGLDPSAPLMVYIGKLADVRGIFTMIDALPHLPGVHAAFVGNQDDVIRQRMRTRAEELGVADRIHVKGYVPSSSVTWYIAGATLGISPLLPTPAHELAVPTKLREYVQAELPIVVSDLREQANFVTENGVGTVFAPGQADSLAEAVRRLLADTETFRAAVTDPAFRDQHTWEGAEKILTALWHRLCPVPPPGSEAPAPATVQVDQVQPSADGMDRDRQAGPTLAVVGGNDAEAMAAAWAQHAGPAFTSPGRSPLDESLVPSLSTVLDRWLRIDADADAVLYAGRYAASGQIEGGTLMEMRSLLNRDKAVGLFSGGIRLSDPRSLGELVPGHPVVTWAPEIVDRYRRQARRSAQPLLDLRDAGVPLFTSMPLDGALPGVHWCPAPIPETPARPDARSGEVSILVVPTSRTAAEDAAVERMCTAAESAGHRVLRPRSRNFAAPMAAEFDLVVDALHTGESSEAAAWAWRAGRIVVGQALRPVTGVRADLPAPPTVVATEDDLAEQILDWAEAMAAGRTEERSRAGREYGAAVHDGRLTARILCSVLGS
ncbi:glycosyltransferase family 4 protein [Citricoccus zhacaiensis]